MDIEQRASGLEIAPGDRVEVRDHFEGDWARGFEVAALVDEDIVRVKRVSDGAVLPWMFGPGDLRRSP